MKKILTAILAVALLVFSGADANAGKGYSSGGGRSYSSGSRSFSSPSRSFSSPSRSFSSGSKSYSSGSKGYSSGSKSYTSGHTSSTHAHTGPPSSGSKSYTSGNKGYTSAGGSSYSRKPTGSFQSIAAAEQRKAESRVHYQKATTPRETYTTPKGNTVTIKKDDARVISIRNMPEEKWVNRETRVQTFYHNYYHSVPTTVVHYNDPYSTFFWLWLMDRSVNDRAYWAYCHAPGTPYAMDEARYRDLLAKDKNLEARIKQLEAEKKARDPNYVPPGMDDPDLQYTDDYVNAVVNPQLKPYNGPTFAGFLHGVWVLIKWCFYIALTIAVIWFAVWFVFYKRW